MTKTAKFKLTDLDLVLLSHAASRPDGMVLPPPTSVRARGKTLEKALAKLLRLGLVEEGPAEAPEQAWREDEVGRRIALRIVAAGRQALGLDAGPEAQTDSSSDAPDGAQEQNGTESESAAEARAPRETAAASAPFAPGVRPGTKQARLVDYLSRPWGVSIADLSRLLGWQLHTVRAALTGLRKKGYQVTSTKEESGSVVYRASPPMKATDDA